MPAGSLPEIQLSSRRTSGFKRFEEPAGPNVVGAVAIEIEKGGIIRRKRGRANFVRPKYSTGLVDASDDLGFSCTKLGLKRFWNSLPRSGKVLLVLSILESILLLLYSVYTCLDAVPDSPKPSTWDKLRPSKDEEIHVALGLGITALFFCGFVVGALWNENGYELLAAVVLAVTVAARIIYFQVSHRSMRNEYLWIPFVVVVALLCTITVGLSVHSFNNFGWRVYGRLVTDYRQKDVATRKKLFQARAALSTVGKLDLQFLLVLTIVGIDITFEKQEGQFWWTVFAFNIAGLFVGLLLALWAWQIGMHPRRLIGHIVALDVAMMLSFVQPLANIIILATHRARDKANADTSLFISCGLYMVFRLARLVCLHLVLELDQALDQGEAEDEEPVQGYQREMVPMMRGTWLGKPSAGNPNKQRYFQLAQDKRKLRWSWNKYVWLINIKSMTGDHSAWDITLSFTLDPDITLKFFSEQSYRQWLLGFELLLVVLLAPSVEEQTDLAIDSAQRRELLKKVGFRVEDDVPQRRLHIQREARPLLETLESRRIVDPEQRKKRVDLAAVLGMLGMQPRIKSIASHYGPDLRPPPMEPKMPPRQASAANAPLYSAHIPAGEPPSFGRQSTATSFSSSEAPDVYGNGSLAMGSAAPSAVSVVEMGDAAAGPWQGPSPAPQPQPAEPTAPLQGWRSRLSHVVSGTQQPPDQQAELLLQPMTEVMDSVADLSASPGEGPPQESSSAVWLRITSGGSEPDLASSSSGTLPGLRPQADPAGPDPGVSNTFSAEEYTSMIEVEVVDMDDIKMGAVIGRGGQGMVCSAWLEGLPVAVKQFREVRDSFREIEMHQAAQGHPNVVGLHAMCYDSGQLFLIMELCPQDSLHKQLKDQLAKKRTWDLRKLLPIVRGVAAGIAHLHTHEPPILHRDLKPGNIFVVDTETVKIGDFGMSRFVELTDIEHPRGTGLRKLVKMLTRGLYGTLNYSPPDLFPEPPTPLERIQEMLAIDVFQFGGTLWEILAFRAPFGDAPQELLSAKLVLRDEEFLKLPRPTFKDADPGTRDVLERLADIVESCRHFDPMQRPTALEIYQAIQELCEFVGIPPAAGCQGTS